MPRYHCRDTEVQLCTWEPLSRQPVLDSSSPAPQTSASHSNSTSTSDFRTQKDALAFNGGLPPYDLARSHRVKRLAEEYFKGREGLDFLGCDAPFFLIHAGNNLSVDTYSAEPLTRMNNSVYQDHEDSLESSEKLVRTPLLKSSTTAKTASGVSYVESTVKEANQDPNDSNKVYLSSGGSSRSSLSSTAFLSPYASDLRSEEPQSEIGGCTFGEWKSNICKPQSNRASSF